MKQTNTARQLTHMFGKTDHHSGPADVATHEQAGIRWIDIQNPSRHALDELAKTHAFNEVHVAQSLQKGHITQVSVEHNYIYVIINFPFYVESSNRIIASQISAFVGEGFLITVHGGHNPLLRQLFEFYKTSNQQAQSAAEILYHIIEEHLAATAAIIEQVFGELDAAESAVFDDKISDAYLIGQLRQKIIGLRRTLTNQHEVLDELGNSIHQFTAGRLRHHYKTNANVSRKLWDATDEAKEIIEIYQDVDFTTSTAKTNRILAVLTLLFTLTIPATVIGTFYGMNVLLPGGIESGSWTFLGHYTMLKLISAVSILGAVIMYAYFWRKKWL